MIRNIQASSRVPGSKRRGLRNARSSAALDEIVSLVGTARERAREPPQARQQRDKFAADRIARGGHSCFLQRIGPQFFLPGVRNYRSGKIIAARPFGVERHMTPTLHLLLTLAFRRTGARPRGRASAAQVAQCRRRCQAAWRSVACGRQSSARWATRLAAPPIATGNSVTAYAANLRDVRRDLQRVAAAPREPRHDRYRPRWRAGDAPRSGRDCAQRGSSGGGAPARLHAARDDRLGRSRRDASWCCARRKACRHAKRWTRCARSIPNGAYDFNHIYLGAGDAASAPAQPAASVERRRRRRAHRVDRQRRRRDHPALRGLSIRQRGFAARKRSRARTARKWRRLIAGADSGFVAPRRRNALCCRRLWRRADRRRRCSIGAALGWMAEQRVPVINVSLVGPSQPCFGGWRACRWWRAAHIIVAAVGNDGPSAPPLYPASYPGRGRRDGRGCAQPRAAGSRTRRAGRFRSAGLGYRARPSQAAATSRCAAPRMRRRSWRG